MKWMDHRQALIKLKAKLPRFQGLTVKGKCKKLKNEVADKILVDEAIRKGFMDVGYSHEDVQEVRAHNCSF